MARILLHTLVFSPDGVSTAILISELTIMLMNKYQHEITVLTTTPHYNRSETSEQSQPFRKHWFGLYYTSFFHGAHVIHIVMPKKNGRKWQNLGYLWFHFWGLILGILLVGKQDVVLSPSPPLTIGIVSWLLAKLKGGKFIYNVQEVYPAYLLNTGAMHSGSFMHRVLTIIEKLVYWQASRISVITEQLHQEVLKVCNDKSKIILIPNFSLIEFDEAISRDNYLSEKLGLISKFVVMYAGNIGSAHSFETIVEVMTKVADDKRIHFLIVGDGVRRLYLEAEIQIRQLHNVTLLPYRPINEMAIIYATSDIGLVPLKAGAARSATPSKIYTVMAAGLPVLASVDIDSDTAKLVDIAKCGIAIEPDNPTVLESAIRWCCDHPIELKIYRNNARQYINQNYSRDTIASMYQNLILDISLPLK